ncbi:hypothetical protein LOZ52_001223 [Ophidiomyces ophidiicola]|nr:hypothetical protein LOZ64_001156 [Ophidiomyces ophidiicola]KAI2006441.1 hypothetical protein LOZ49_005013 [Ophidiomyces ophidiicola]KAI2008127.1 hypothetical protein LOZ50_002125 [Ophidiomyces ophidiicola]KAI2025793.1 hypothetical protein LOZ46_000727 [Ophidiomyces ophidiicola]KAI2059749.1 hypothetical protein LOZ44_000432 [Ophidiomyces ophidiicola]
MRLLPILITLPGVVVAGLGIPESARCIISIGEALSRLRFLNPSHSSYTAYVCTNRLYVYSMYAASKTYCTASEIYDGLRVIDRDCEQEGLTRIPYEDVEPELSDEYLAGLKRVEYGEFNKGTELPEPVLISKDYFQRAFRTNRAWALETWAHHAFGVASYLFWGTVLFCGILSRLYEHYLASRALENVYDQERDSCARTKLPRWLVILEFGRDWAKAHLFFPPAVGDYHQRLLYWCTIPTRMEAMVIVSFYLLSLGLTVIGHDVFKGNLHWDDVFTQTWRYLSDRTGIMAYANLVVLWLFGGRNNPFLWATGWSFGTFNLFHRAIARVATIQAIIHSVGYTVLTLNTNTYSVYWPSAWWYMGAVGTIGMSLLLGFSSIWLRRNYYEVFLLIHILLSVVVLVGLFIHTSIFVGKYNAYDIYLWPVVVVWVVDRIARLVKLARCNFHVQRNGMKLITSKGRANYDRASNLIRLEISPGSSTLLPQPGQFYYIYQPLKWRGYESHPFTAGSWAESPKVVQDGMYTHLNTEMTKDRAAARRKIIFWIRPFNGWTRRLRSECLRSQDYTIHSTFLIEGPYGNPISLHTYENVILIAGGTGIAGVWPHLEEHMRRSYVSARGLATEHGPETSDMSESLPSAVTCTKNITLIFASRQQALNDELFCSETLSLLEQKGVKIEFYSTSQSDRPALLADENTGLLSQAQDTYGPRTSISIAMKHGRPDIKKSVSQVLYDTFGNDRSLHGAGTQTVVLVCGPAAMADETRAAVRGALKAGYRAIDYYEEAFNW